MQPNDIDELSLYALEMWPRTFKAPSGELRARIFESVWMDVLGDLEAVHVRAAMASWESEWPPTPHQLRQKTLNMFFGEKPPPDVDEAFAEVLEAVRTVGYTSTPIWGHLATSQTVLAIGGWRAICEDTNLPALRAHFQKLYLVAAARVQRQTQPPIPIVERTQRPPIAELVEGPQKIDQMTHSVLGSINPKFHPEEVTAGS